MGDSEGKVKILDFDCKDFSSFLEKEKDNNSPIDPGAFLKQVNKTVNKFILLANDILNGKCVPFLGAGVSLTARHKNNKKIPLSVNDMCKRLLDHIYRDLCKNQKDIVHKIFSFDSDKKEESQDENNIYKVVNGHLAKLTEALLFVGVSISTIVKELEIREFVDLIPTPGHFYMIFLAKENLIDEVITTNYDCCFENAMFLATSLEFFPGQLSEQQRVYSIYNLHTYRKYSSYRFLNDTTNTILKVYKPNGCADALRRGEQPADTILLTEKQLQHMDDRAWARDLLRDRIRSKTIIFSGFGSDEPQVRFPVLRVLEEFSNDKNRVDDGEDGSKIWIQVYNNESFVHYQMLHVHWQQKQSPPCFDREYKEHIFGPEDTKILKWLSGDSDKKEKPLTADMFWKFVYYFVLLALVERYTREGSNFWYWLKKMDEQPRPYYRRRQFLSLLDPYKIGEKIHKKDVNFELKRKDLRKLLHTFVILDKLFAYRKSEIEGIPFLACIRLLYGKKNRSYVKIETFYNSLLKHKYVFLSLLYCFLSVIQCYMSYRKHYILTLYDIHNFLLLKFHICNNNSIAINLIITGKCYQRKDKTILKKEVFNNDILCFIVHIPHKTELVEPDEVFLTMFENKVKIFYISNISVVELIKILLDVWSNAKKEQNNSVDTNMDKNNTDDNNEQKSINLIQKIKVSLIKSKNLQNRNEQFHSVRLRRLL